MSVPQVYIFRWNRPGLPGRKGEKCTIVRRGKMNSCQVRFEDGSGAIVSRNSLRKAGSGERKSAGA